MNMTPEYEAKHQGEGKAPQSEQPSFPEKNIEERLNLSGELREFLRWVANEKDYESTESLIKDILQYYRTQFWEQDSLIDNL